MAINRIAFARLIAIVTTGVLFAGGGHIAATLLIANQQMRQVTDLAQVALMRTESKIASGIEALEAISKNGPMRCDPLSLQTARLNVYRSSSLKDVRAVSDSGVVRCSAFSETLEFDKNWTSPAEMIPGSRTDLRYFQVEQFFGIALGLLKVMNDGSGIVGILGFDSSYIDVLPVNIRKSSRVSIELHDGSLLAETLRLAPAHGDIQSYEIRSEDYPLKASIEIPQAVLSNWNTEIYLPIVALSLLIGTAFGLLLARLIGRPRDLISEIDRAIANGEFVPFYQPIFELETGRIVGAEVLARWLRTDGKSVPPARFIELAEESGRIDAITWQQIEQATRDLQSILATEPEFRLSFNITPTQFLSEDFIPQLERQISESEVNRSQITIELTEREAFDDTRGAAKKVRALRGLGYRIYLDDVGVGHSGLSQIQSLDVDGIKIDKFFVDAIHEDESTSVVIEMLVRLAHQRGMGLVAEGIESEAQSNALFVLGVRKGQGYFVSPPIPGAAFLGRYGHHKMALSKQSGKCAA